MHRSIGLLALLVVPTVVAAGDIPAYRWTRDVDLPEIPSTTLVGIRLDSDFFLATRDGWPDVRLRNDRDESVAFLIRTVHDLKTRTVRHTWLASQRSARLDDAVGLQIELTSSDKEPIPNGIRVITPLKDFEHQVRVELSSDGETWTSAGAPTLIFDYSRFVDARNDTIPIDAGNHRRFRLTIEDVTAEQERLLMNLHRRLHGSEETDRIESTAIIRRPFRIDRIEFYHDSTEAESRRTTTTTYPAAHFEATEREKDHQTVLTFHTQREPITQITVDTTSENFSRTATVEAERDDATGKKAWKPLATGTLTRFMVGTIQRDERILTIPESQALRYRVIIENRDSPPLSTTGVELAGPQYELTFLASPDQKLTVEYGSSEAKAGHYDTAALRAALSHNQASSLTKWGSARENANVPADRSPRWTIWNDTRVLIGAIIGLTVLLGWGLFVAARRIETQPPA